MEETNILVEEVGFKFILLISGLTCMYHFIFLIEIDIFI